MSSFLVVTVLVVVAAIVMIRMIPDPERSSHTLFDEYFSVHSNQGPFSKFKVIHSAAETNGKFYEMQELFPKTCGKGWTSSCAPPYHIHPRQNETFKVLQGQALFKVDGVEKIGNVGDEIMVLAGAKHHFTRGPDSNDDLLIDFKLEPALK
jgi:mannose-6-phosphate isomerase-like protein (cupin superfamily)